MIEIVVNLKAVNRGLSEQNRTGAAEDVHKPVVLPREKGV